MMANEKRWCWLWPVATNCRQYLTHKHTVDHKQTHLPTTSSQVTQCFYCLRTAAFGSQCDVVFTLWQCGTELSVSCAHEWVEEEGENGQNELSENKDKPRERKEKIR